MRVPWLASLVLIGIVGRTVPATAQHERAPGLPSIGLPLPPIGIPLPSIGLPLPPIGAPLPPIGLSGTGTVAPAHAALPHRPPGRGPHGAPHPGAPIYAGFYPVFYPVGYPIDVGAEPTTGTPGAPSPGQPIAPTFELPPGPPLGSLRLQVEPTAGQQIFVDGSFVGTPEDLDGDLALDAGLHVVEVQAPGFDSVRLPIRIVAGRTITYRGTLQSSTRVNDAGKTAQPPPSAPAISTAPATVGYYIPGCYLGNVPPEDVTLPGGCDPKHAVIVTSWR